MNLSFIWWFEIATKIINFKKNLVLLRMLLDYPILLLLKYIFKTVNAI